RASPSRQPGAPCQEGRARELLPEGPAAVDRMGVLRLEWPGEATRGARPSGSVRLNRGMPAQRGEVPMPLVQVKLIEGVFSDAQKQEMIRKLTDAMVSIEGE